MFVTLPLSEMSVPEKLRIMEELWADLTRHADLFESPEWHGTILEEREAKISSGEAKFTDWESAKATIRQRIS